MIISSGLCSVVAILNFVYTVSPFCLLFFDPFAKLIKILSCCCHMTFRGINGSLVHYLREHLIGRLLAGSEPI